MSSFREGCELGSGSYATVFKCLSRVDGWIYAIKRTNQPFGTEANRQRVLRESFAMASLPAHPNVVRYFSSWIQDQRLFLQLEWCNGGSLGQLLHRGQQFPEKVLVEILSQVSSVG
jgi:wee1-like protein kinase